MNIYDQIIFPRLLDQAMHRPVLAVQRQKLLALAQGKVLEIGFGTGANLPHYGDQVTSLHVVEPERLLPRRVDERIRQRGLPIHWHSLAGEYLPFEAKSFDTVVCTLTLCSVDNPAQVLQEMRRVLKPSGQLLLLEHGLSPDNNVAKWQHRLNGINRACGGGCNITRPMRSLLENAGFGVGLIEEFYLDKTPQIGGYMTLAVLPAC